MEKGQEILIKDLEALLSEVKAGEFGDFSNMKYVNPKMKLRVKLAELVNNVDEGKYD